MEMRNSNMDFTLFHAILEKNNTFLITSHVDPDGDALGSMLALYYALIKIGKKVILVKNDKTPDKYLFLPGIDRIQNFCNEKVDIIITLDCGSIERLGFTTDLKAYGDFIVNIDHHKNGNLFGDLNYIDSNASSVGEILYYLIKEITSIDYNIALCLYTSIVTDTGSMRYSNTTPSSLRILAEFIELGIKPDYVSRQVFENRSLPSILLLKETLNTLEIIADGQIATMYITKDMLKKCEAQEEDINGIINYAREIKNVEVAVLLSEQQNNLVKVSFRSNEWVNVNCIAEEFNGGGHARAAGCTIDKPLAEAKDIILKSVKRYFKQIK